MVIFGSSIYFQIHLKATCWEILNVHFEFAFVIWTLIYWTFKREVHYMLQDEQTCMVPFTI